MIGDPWVIPASWEWTISREIAEIIGGGTPRTDDPSNFEGGDIPWITPADLSGYREKFISHGARNITKKGLDNSGARVMPEGAVLFSSRAPIGYVAIASNPVSTNQGFKSFVLCPAIGSDFAYYYFLRARQLAVDLSSGTTFREISGAKAALIPFPVAPLREQARIVAEIEKQFTRLDAAVGALKRVQANLKRYRAAVLKAAVEGLLVPTEAELARREGRSYEPASELLKRIVAERRARWETRNNRAKKMRLLNEEPLAPEQTNLSGLPEGWSWTSLDALLREPLRNGHSAKESGSSDGVPTFTLSAVTYGDFSAANIKITTANAEKVEDLWVQPDDIFVERSNTPELVGTCRRYVGPPRPAIFPDLLIRVRLVTSAVPAYIELALQAERTQRFFREKAQGISGTMPKIDQGVVEKVAVPLPPIAEQTRIVVEAERRFSIVDELHAEVENDLKRAERLRQAILKSAFEGKLVPQDPSDEPASVLLERIRAERVRRAEELKPSNASLRKPRKKKEVATA